MKNFIFLIPILLFYPLGSQAHGPVRELIKATVIIYAPANEVWDVIKDFGDMSWHPSIKSIEAVNGNEKGDIRILTLKGGGTITEELKRYKDEKMEYKYNISKISTLKTIQHWVKYSPLVKIWREEDGEEPLEEEGYYSSEIVPVFPVGNYKALIKVKEDEGISIVTWKATYYRVYANNNPPEELDDETAYWAVKDFLTTGLIHLLKKFDASGNENDISIDYRGRLDEEPFFE